MDVLNIGKTNPFINFLHGNINIEQNRSKRVDENNIKSNSQQFNSSESNSATQKNPEPDLELANLLSQIRDLIEEYSTGETKNKSNNKYIRTLLKKFIKSVFKSTVKDQKIDDDIISNIEDIRKSFDTLKSDEKTDFIDTLNQELKNYPGLMKSSIFSGLSLDMAC